MGSNPLVKHFMLLFQFWEDEKCNKIHTSYAVNLMAKHELILE